MQNFLTRATPGTSNHIYGSSITNQAIEQWWKGFRERHEEFFKSRIHELCHTGYYDENTIACRVLLVYVYIPLIQKKLDYFKEYWNTHPVRKQDIYRPCGIPDFMYKFPKSNGGVQCGIFPDVSDMQFLKKQTNTLKNLEFIDSALKFELRSKLDADGLYPVNIKNANTAYINLFKVFGRRNLEFTFS